MTNEEIKKLLAPDGNNFHKCESCGAEVLVAWDTIKIHLKEHLKEEVMAELKAEEEDAEPIESLKGLLESKV